MAGNSSEGLGDDFFEQILAVPPAYSNTEVTGYGRAGAADIGAMPMVLQLGSSVSTDDASCCSASGSGLRGMGSIGVGMPLGLNLEQGFMRHDQDSARSFKFSDGLTEANDSRRRRHHHVNNHNNNSAAIPSSSSALTGMTERESVHMANLFPALSQLHAQSIRPTAPPPSPPAPPPQLQQPFQGQPPPVGPGATAPQPPAIRPRVRARRGQATDPHSIAERLRRERIAERMKALQELVPSANKTDRAAMLDEIVDYVKFLRLQVKVLSMSRLGGAGAVAQLVADVPLSTMEAGDRIDGGTNQQSWEKWSNDGTEQQVAKLMEEDIGSAMQFLQSKALCIMPISLASAIFRYPQSDTDVPAAIKTESNNH